jgi:hypothetical protein
MTDSMFPTEAHCSTCGRQIPAPAAPCDWCAKAAAHLARRGDPHTSHAAAGSLNHQIKEHHAAVLNWYKRQGPQTDDEVAQAMVDMRLTARSETARRWVRTLREEHDGLIVPYVDPATGEQGTRRNVSGRFALMWHAANT